MATPSDRDRAFPMPLADRFPAAEPGNGAPRARSLSTAIVLATLVVNLVVVAMATFSLRTTREAALERVDASIRNLAELVERDVSSTLDKAGVSLAFVTSHLEAELHGRGIERDELGSLLVQAVEMVPGTRRIDVFDANGNQLCGLPDTHCPYLRVADRDHFQRLKTDPDAGLVVTGPHRSRVDNDWALLLARSYRDRNGGFAGTAVATVPLRGIQSLFEQVDLGEHGAITLRTADLAQVVRHPGPIRSDDEAVNRKVSDELHRAVLARPDGGFYDAPTALDGIERRNAYKRFARYPLYILVGLAPGDFLGPWRGDAAITVASCLIFLVTSSGLAALLVTSLRRREASAATVQRLLAERSAMLDSDVIAAAHLKDRHIVWASPSFSRMFGYAPGSLAGLASRALYPDDESHRAFGLAMDESLARSSIHRAELELVRRQGERLWVEVQITRLDPQSGELLATFVDVSERRRAQQDLADSERRFRLASESGGIGFWSTNVATGRAWRSERHAEIFGHPPGDQDWSAERLLTHVVPEDRERVREAIAVGLRQGRIDWKARIVRSDGTVRWIVSHGEAVRGEGGAPDRIMGSIVDVTALVEQEESLRQSERRFRLASMTGHVGVVEMDLETGKAWRSESHARLFGHAATDVDWSLDRFLSHVLPEERGAVRETYRQALRTGTYQYECRISRSDGAIRWIAARGALVSHGDGVAPSLMGTVEDVTERRLREDQLRFQGEVLRNMEEGVSLVRVGTGEIVYANPKFEALFGYGPGELVGANARILQAPESEGGRPWIGGHPGDGWQGDVHNVRKDGSLVWTHACISRLSHREHGEVWVNVQGDIDARKRLEFGLQEANTLLEGLAVRDPLTGLFNRRYLDETVARELHAARRGGYPVAFLLIDVDRFKAINDAHGHAAGDEVLRALARALEAATRSSDVACRFGGEEFLLVMPGVDPEAALAKAEELRARMASSPAQAAGRSIAFTVSIGVSCFPQDGEDGARVIEQADLAMYAAKNAGRDCVRAFGAATGRFA